MRTGRVGVREITVALSHPNELLESLPADVASGRPPGVPAIEQIRRELSSGSLRAPVKLVVQVPADHATPQVERGIVFGGVRGSAFERGPKDIRDFFGNGLFLVAAWVGIWYPLDTLIYTGRPYRFERRLLRVMGAMEIVVGRSAG